MLAKMNACTPLTRTPTDATPPRAIGGLALSVRYDRGGSHIQALRQSGSLKALFPRPTGAALEAVVLNTAGGLTGGDRMQVTVGAAIGSHAILSSQAAERVYRTVGPGWADVAVTLKIGSGARIDWLPQETILYEASALARRVDADLAHDARMLLVEPLIFGRAAMGETLRSGLLRDSWRVRRAGALVFADALLLQGDIATTLARAGVAGGAGAMASVLYVGPDAAARLTGLRQLLPRMAGCSLIRDGVLFSRLYAPDGFDLRQTLMPMIEYLSAAPLPKVWRL